MNFLFVTHKNNITSAFRSLNILYKKDVESWRRQLESNAKLKRLEEIKQIKVCHSPNAKIEGKGYI